MASMLSPPFSYLGEALRLVGERTGGDGLGALAVAAASGQITGEGIAFLIAPGSANPEQQGEEFTSVPDGWWAQIRLLGWRARTERELLSVTTVDVANDTISRFFFAAAPVWFREPSLPYPALDKTTFRYRVRCPETASAMASIMVLMRRIFRLSFWTASQRSTTGAAVGVSSIRVKPGTSSP